jgi:hypothetical protein
LQCWRWTILASDEENVWITILWSRTNENKKFEQHNLCPNICCNRKLHYSSIFLWDIPSKWKTKCSPILKSHLTIKKLKPKIMYIIKVYESTYVQL